MSCAGCARPLGNAAYLEALEQSWHVACFACEACGASLQGREFFVLAESGRRVCGACVSAPPSSNGCHKCARAITGDSVSDREGRRFHADCFTCYVCGRLIDGEYFSDLFLMHQPCCVACHASEKPKLTQRPPTGRWANK